MYSQIYDRSPSLPLINPKPKGQGVYQRYKLSMTEDEGHIFVEYIVGAVVHITYTIAKYIPFNSHEIQMIPMTKCSRNMSDEAT